MQQLLGSWKEIAVYLNRGVRTTQRWEKQNSLPVYRVGKGTKSPVFAYRFEIDAWLRTHAGAAHSSSQAVIPVRPRASYLDRDALERQRTLRAAMCKLMIEQKQKVFVLSKYLKDSDVQMRHKVINRARTAAA